MNRSGFLTVALAFVTCASGQSVGADGMITTVAGTDRNDRASDGGLATQASFGDPSHIAAGCAGVFVTDTETVRKIAFTAPLIAYDGVSAVGGKNSNTLPVNVKSQAK